MVKKIIALLLATAILAGMSACDKEEDMEREPTEKEKIMLRDPSIPTLDWAEEDANSNFPEVNYRGNTIGNTNNFGLAALQGDWIYYIANNYQIFKIRTDGTENTLVCGDYALWLNVVGEWIYYHGLAVNGLYKIRTNGKDWSLVTEDQAGYINVVGDWVYYSNGSDEGKLYKVHIDGGDSIKLNNDESEFVSVVGNDIYYVSVETENNEWVICKTDVNGGEREIIYNESVDYITIDNEWLYYINADGESEPNIYRMSLDGVGKNPERINDDESYSLNVSGGWVYYANDDDGGKIYRIRTDGTEKMKLNDDESIDINLVGNWVYYRNLSETDPETNNALIYRMRPDGSARQRLR